MFSIEAPGVEENLNKGDISELKKMFETNGFPLSDNDTIRKEKDEKWEVTNGEKIYIVTKEKGKQEKGMLNIYTRWNDNEIEECTQLVIDSIGGNPRKIKRVLNATMLIQSVFEKRLATLLQAFESPKPRKKIERMGEGKGKRREIEEPMALRIKISSIFTPSEVFKILFEKKVLFKLMCMRE